MNAAHRRSLLLAAAEVFGGEWDTSRTMRLYRMAGLRVPRPRTARKDLARAHRDHFLTRHATPTRTWYTPLEETP